MPLKGDAITKEKNDIRYLINFHPCSRKSKNLHFDGLVLSKAYKFSIKKYGRVMSHDTEE